MVAPIAAAIRYAIAFETSGASKAVGALASDLNGLKKSAEASFSTVFNAAVGPLASPTGMAANFVSPLGQAIGAYQTSIVGAGLNAAGGMFGMSGLGDGAVGLRNKAIGVGRGQEQLENVVAGWARSGVALSDNAIDTLSSGLTAREQFVAQQVSRAQDRGGKRVLGDIKKQAGDATANAALSIGMSAGFAAMEYDIPTYWGMFKRAAKLGFETMR